MTPQQMAVPIRERWRWAKILVKVMDDGRPRPRLRRVGYWWTLIGGAVPVTVDGGAMAGLVIGPGRMSAYGSASLAVLLMAPAMAMAMSVPPPWGLAAFLLAFAAGRVTVHAQRCWRFGRRRAVVWVSNVVRDPRYPKGTGRVVMEAVCEWADADERPLALETRHPTLVSYYEEFGFGCVGPRVEEGRSQAMFRAPTRGRPPPTRRRIRISGEAVGFVLCVVAVVLILWFFYG